MFGQVLKWGRENRRLRSEIGKWAAQTNPIILGVHPRKKILSINDILYVMENCKKNTTRFLLAFWFFIYRRFVPQFKKRMPTNENCFYNQCNIVVKKSEINNSHES